MKSRTIAGYAAVFHNPKDPGTEFELMKGLMERIAPTAFTKSLRSENIRALAHHDAGRLLGSTAARTLRLSTDAWGLKFELDLPDTADGTTIYELVARGDLSGMSFGFRPVKTTYTRGQNGKPDIATLEEVRLLEVSPVSWPAYTGTSVYQRSDALPGSVRYMHETRKCLPRHLRDRLDEIDLHEEVAKRLEEISKN